MAEVVDPTRIESVDCNSISFGFLRLTSAVTHPAPKPPVTFKFYDE